MYASVCESVHCLLGCLSARHSNNPKNASAPKNPQIQGVAISFTKPRCDTNPRHGMRGTRLYRRRAIRVRDRPHQLAPVGAACGPALLPALNGATAAPIEPPVAAPIALMIEEVCARCETMTAIIATVKRAVNIATALPPAPPPCSAMLLNLPHVRWKARRDLLHLIQDCLEQFQNFYFELGHIS